MGGSSISDEKGTTMTNWKNTTMYALETLEELRDENERKATDALTTYGDEQTYMEHKTAAHALDSALARIRGYAGM